MGDLSWRFDKREYEYIKEVLDTGFASSTSGNMNTRLEEAFANKFGQKFAITFNSGTLCNGASSAIFHNFFIILFVSNIDFLIFPP